MVRVGWQIVIHTSTCTQTGIGIKGEQEVKLFARESEKKNKPQKDKRYCRQWHGRFMRTSSVRETKNLCTHWPSLSAVFQSEATHSPVLWFGSLVSCPPAFCCGVFRPSVCLTWSVSEKLQSPGKFCRPPIIMAAHKGPNPVLLIILSPLFLYLGWCTLDLDGSRKARANMCDNN